MVGHETLDLGVEVRILPRQLAYLRGFAFPGSSRGVGTEQWKIEIG